MAAAAPSPSRPLILIVALTVLILIAGGLHRAGVFARPYALKALPRAQPYLGFPAQPEFASDAPWTTEAAFPNVTFKYPVVMEPEPGTDRLFIGELEGTIVALGSRDPATSEKTTVLDLTRQTQGGFDSGLLGLAFHPEYGREGSPHRDFVYVFYSWNPNPVMVGRPEPETVTWSRVSRFTMDRATGRLRPESEQVLIHQRKRIIFHVGGAMFFHPRDGFLYVAVGDEGGQQDALNNAQRIDRNLFAGVLRLDVDQRGGAISHPIPRQPADGATAHYFIPNDNPFVGVPGALEEFYAIGLRSPHRMTYDAVDDRAWIGEIGQAAREEIEVLRFDRAPQNFQWAFKEGSRPGFKPRPAQPLGHLTDAVWEYGRDQGRSVTGGYVYRGRRHPTLTGKYLCSDFANGRIWALTYAIDAGQVRVTAAELLATGEGFRNYHGGAGGVTSFGLDHQNEIYLLRHGRSTRIERLVESKKTPGNVPAQLSRTGAFADWKTLQPAPGLLPYEVNVPQWANGALIRRWISVPAGRTIRFHATERWAFPPGTVLIEHFDWARTPGDPAKTRPIETRFLVTREDGTAYGVTYRWKPDRSDALLVTSDDESETLETVGENGERVRVLWVYPSPKNCLQCHTAGAGHVLGVKTRQLSREIAYPGGVTDHQLRTWNGLGLFAPGLDERRLPAHPVLAGLADTAAPLETRVRSYLDVNCAHCHGSTAIPAAWSGHFTTRLAEQGLLFGPVLGFKPRDDYHVISPRDPDGSELWQRVRENIIGKRMPPLGSDRVDAPFVRALGAWIDQLPRIERTPPRVVAATVRDATTIALTFSEAVRAGDGPDGAENPRNYALTGAAAVQRAVLAPDRVTVVLTTTARTGEAEAIVRVSGVADRAEPPNAVPPGTEVRLPRRAP